VDVVLRAKAAGLPVLLGLEVDFVPGRIYDVLEAISPYPWDLLIGSVHWLGGWWFDRAAVAPEWERRGHRAVYEEFFALSAEMAASATLDVVAHPDRLKCLGHRLPAEPADLYAGLIDAAAGSGTALEVNTGGLRHPVAEIYPSPTLLRMAADAGLDITLASDGHYSDQAGWALGRAAAAARDAGFTHYARFVGRNREIVPLPEGLADD
jgi:histidinol-phosphatase (PHP family)